MINSIKTIVKLSKIKPEDIKTILDMTTIRTGERKYAINFDKIIPEPMEESECPDEYKLNKDTHIEILTERKWFNWHKWHMDYWGTMWEAYNCYTNVGKTYIMFIFHTAWTVPIPIIKKLSVLGYPIDVKYASEEYGINCGKLKYTREQGWTHQNSLDMKNPVRFARDLWNNY